MFRSLSSLPISKLFLYISSFQHSAFGNASPYGHHNWHSWSQSQPSHAPVYIPSPGYEYGDYNRREWSQGYHSQAPVNRPSSGYDNFGWNYWDHSQHSQVPVNIPSSPINEHGYEYDRPDCSPSQHTERPATVPPLPMAQDENSQFVGDVRRPNNQQTGPFVNISPLPLANNMNTQLNGNVSTQPEALANNTPLPTAEIVPAQADASERSPSQVSEAPLSTDTPVKNDKFNCTLPPRGETSYLVTEPSDKSIIYKAGDKLRTYSLIWYCSLGYSLLGFKTTNCYEDGSTDTGGEIPECVPQCDMESNNIVVTNKVPRCIPPPTEEKAIPTRFQTKVNKTKEFQGCGTDMTHGAYVSGGREAEEKELPWHAGIYTKNTKPYMQICGGSIIHKLVIISAAHCFWSEIEKQLPASNFAVAAGKLYRPWNDQHDTYPQKSDVADIKIPSYFQGSSTNLQDDIALVLVTVPFEFSGDFKVYPICVDFDLEKDKTQLTPGSYGMVGGWGLTSEDGPASPVLKVADMPVIDIKQCFEQSDPTFKPFITSDKICAGYENGTAVCKGDSGGGLAFKETSWPNRHYLRGVVSGAPASDHLCNTYAWASFTHIQRHEAFITEVIRSLPLVNN